MAQEKQNIEEQKPAWSEDFEQNISNLLHNKLMWHSDDGSMSTAVFIDDKTMKDIITGIWFYVAKEAMKHPNMELPKQEWGEVEKGVLDSIIDDYEKASKSFCGYDGKIGLLKAIRDGEYNLPSPVWSEEEKDKEIARLKFLRSKMKQECRQLTYKDNGVRWRWLNKKKFIQWIYDRMVYVHNENPNVDYMLTFKELIDSMEDEQ